MKIEFEIEVYKDDYEDYGGDDVLEALWMHYEAIEWLDSQQLPMKCVKQELLDVQEFECVQLRLEYTITEQVLTEFVLKFPYVFADNTYQQVRILKAN